MLPKWHILIGFIFSYLLVYFLNFSLLAGVVVFVSSWFLIDLDHYFLYIFMKRDFNFSRFYDESRSTHKKWLSLSKEEKEKYKRRIYAFHGIECFTIIILLSLFYKIFSWIIIGFLIHIIPDWIELCIIRESFYQKFCTMITIIKNRKKQVFC